MLEGQSVTEWVMFMRFRQLMPVIASDRLSSAIGSQGSAHPLGFFQVSIAIYPTHKQEDEDGKVLWCFVSPFLSERTTTLPSLSNFYKTS